MGKYFFAVNLLFNLFLTTIANVDMKVFKSKYTFLKPCLYQIPVKYEQNCMVQTAQNFELFDKKKSKTKRSF